MRGQVLESFHHQSAFVKFMKDYRQPLFAINIIIYPNFVFWNEVVNQIVAAFAELDVYGISYEPSPNHPHGYVISGLLEQADMDLFNRGLAVFFQSRGVIFGFSSFRRLFFLRDHSRVPMIISLFHKLPVRQQMGNIEFFFIEVGLPVQPELIFWYIRIAIVVSEVGKFYVDLISNRRTVNLPNRYLTAFVKFF